jgi:Mg2+ and Co2+ transporter CorA
LLDLILHEIVARYLSLRNWLSAQLQDWEARLLLAESVDDWGLFMALRRLLRGLESFCEDQADALSTWRDETSQDLDTHLSVRLNDVQERIQRMLRHAQALQHDIEALVQIHFSAASERTNQIVRMLTVISAIFLPLNLIAGIFGMNFEHMPLEQSGYGLWVIFAIMLGLILVLLRYFRRRRWL